MEITNELEHVNGTHFASIYVVASGEQLINTFGKPVLGLTPDGKTNFQLISLYHNPETDKDEVVCFYDYKETNYDLTKVIKYNVGCKNISQDQIIEILEANDIFQYGADEFNNLLFKAN
jgi:hypothetical protein